MARKVKTKGRWSVSYSSRHGNQALTTCTCSSTDAVRKRLITHEARINNRDSTFLKLPVEVKLQTFAAMESPRSDSCCIDEGTYFESNLQNFVLVVNSRREHRGRDSEIWDRLVITQFMLTRPQLYIEVGGFFHSTTTFRFDKFWDMRKYISSSLGANLHIKSISLESQEDECVAALVEAVKLIPNLQSVNLGVESCRYQIRRQQMVSWGFKAPCYARRHNKFGKVLCLHGDSSQLLLLVSRKRRQPQVVPSPWKLSKRRLHSQ